jgi:hypothetical protein
VIDLLGVDLGAGYRTPAGTGSPHGWELDEGRDGFRERARRFLVEHFPELRLHRLEGIRACRFS